MPKSRKLDRLSVCFIAVLAASISPLGTFAQQRITGFSTEGAKTHYVESMGRASYSSPHRVGDARLTFSGFRGFYGTLAYRHTGNYRLDGEDSRIRASGSDVLDLSIRQRIKSWIDFNFSIYNLTNKRYFETQNYFESRARPGDPIVARVSWNTGLFDRGVGRGNVTPVWKVVAAKAAVRMSKPDSLSDT